MLTVQPMGIDRRVHRQGRRTWFLALAITAVLLAAAPLLIAATWLGGSRHQPEPRAPDPPMASIPAPAPAVGPGDHRAPTGHATASVSPRAETLLRAGRDRDAERLLMTWLDSNPDDAAAHYLLGNLYVARPWPSQAIASYRHAMRADPRYRKDVKLLGNTIDLLSSRSAGRDAALLLVGDVGMPAVPLLRQAAAKHPRAAIRKHAARLLLAFTDMAGAP